MKVNLLLTAAFGAPTYDWHRPPSEPIIISEHNVDYDIVREDVKIAKFLRLPVSVRTKHEMVKPVMLAKINIEGEHDAFAVFSHRRRFGGSTHVRYEYSNFCEWLHNDKDQQLRIPLPNTNILRRGDTEIRDIMLYVGYVNRDQERIADVRLEARVINDTDSSNGPYGAGCEVFRYENTVPELVRIADARGYNTDVVVRSNQTVMDLGTLNNDKFLSLTLDVPHYLHTIHKPRLTLALTAPHLAKPRLVPKPGLDMPLLANPELDGPGGAPPHQPMHHRGPSLHGHQRDIPRHDQEDQLQAQALIEAEALLDATKGRQLQMSQGDIGHQYAGHGYAGHGYGGHGYGGNGYGGPGYAGHGYGGHGYGGNGYAGHGYGGPGYAGDGYGGPIPPLSRVGLPLLYGGEFPEPFPYQLSDSGIQGPLPPQEEFVMANDVESIISQFKTILVPYTNDSIWEGLVVKPLEVSIDDEGIIRVAYDLSVLADDIYKSKNMFSDRSVVMSLFIFDLTKRSHTNFRVMANLVMDSEQKAFLLNAASMTLDRDDNSSDTWFNARDIVVEACIFLFLILIVHTLATAIVHLTGKDDGYVVMENREMV